MADLLHATLVWIEWASSWDGTADWWRCAVWKEGLRVCARLRWWLLLLYCMSVCSQLATPATPSNVQPFGFRFLGFGEGFRRLEAVNVMRCYRL